MVAYRTLHRFATERCGYRARETTVRVEQKRSPTLGRAKISVLLDVLKRARPVQD